LDIIKNSEEDKRQKFFARLLEWRYWWFFVIVRLKDLLI